MRARGGAFELDGDGAPTVAVVFPGQGTQRVGMGGWLFRTEIGRSIAEEMSDLLGRDLVRMCAIGPEAELRNTALAQPAIFACNAIAHALLLAEGADVHVVAGHSVGELNALVAAGVVSFATAAELVVHRGRLLEELGSGGTMLAIGGLDRGVVSDLAAEASRATGGVVVAAVVNGPSEVVVSGDDGAVACCGQLASAAGALWSRPVRTSHGFHSPLMQAAVAPWRAAVERHVFADPSLPIVLNLDGQVAGRGDVIRDATIQQLVATVRWDLVCARLAATRPSLVHVEAGDSRLLTSLARRGGVAVQFIGFSHPEARVKVAGLAARIPA
jgi:[acyl-carrier-protein] S-malonyltransferase